MDKDKFKAELEKVRALHKQKHDLADAAWKAKQAWERSNPDTDAYNKAEVEWRFANSRLVTALVKEMKDYTNKTVEYIQRKYGLSYDDPIWLEAVNHWRSQLYRDFEED